MTVMPLNRSLHSATRIIAVALLLITALVTRLQAPWQMDVINDEMIHITNYHPNYENQKFLNYLNQFLSKLDHSYSHEQALRVAQIYNKVYVLQRLQFMIRDAHPPLVLLLAEAINCAPAYKLQIMRICAMLASLAFIWLLYLVGVEYSDDTLGLWLAGLATVSVTFRVYSGIGRPYVFAQLMAALLLLSFLRRKPIPSSTLHPFLLVALFAQATDWQLWPMIAPLLLAAVYERWQAVGSIQRILKESWWYLLGSCALLLIFRVQIANPVVSHNLAASRAGLRVWHYLAVTTPFAELGSLFDRSGHIEPWTSTVAAIFFVLSAIGLAGISFNPKLRLPVRGALAAATVLVGIELFRLPVGDRFYIVPVTILVFCAGIGMNILLHRRTISELALSAVMVVFLAIFLVKPESPYARVFDYETQYSKIAERLSAEMKPGDIWFSAPYFMANNLYLYGAPPPLEPNHDQYGPAIFQQCATSIDCYVLLPGAISTFPEFRAVSTSPSIKVYEFQNRYVLFHYPHQSTGM